MKIHEITINEKPVFISQRKDTFKVVKPWKKDINARWSLKNTNWFNVLTGGSWTNLLLVIIIVVIILGLFNEYSSNIKILQDAVINCMPKILLP